MTGMKEQEARREEDYRWFRENLPELEKRYGDKYVVIKDKRIIGAHETLHKALGCAREREKPGAFLIQLCTTDESRTTWTVI
jgi:hypothetical protein